MFKISLLAVGLDMFNWRAGLPFFSRSKKEEERLGAYLWVFLRFSGVIKGRKTRKQVILHSSVLRKKGTFLVFIRYSETIME